ncbi:16S rRNA (uracil(1498)-N(3))-methyltransferase [Nibrella saemangeumensis]|uniref:Ribosomal RNA small subunit methyltransferase E n=1 Tax=Nibrella saemangeumensis TaxID=1084526 RepID=A0ABP8MGK2_9BACT
MNLFYQPDIARQPYLTEEDSRHAIKTLRLSVGESISVTDGQGTRFDCVITKADARQCAVRIVEFHSTPRRPFSIRLCLAPTKNIDRIEWLVEKAVEIGVERFSFFFSQHSERRVLKTDRLIKIAVAAMKQSLQSYLPQIDEAVSFSQLLAAIQEEHRFIAHLPELSAPEHLFNLTVPQTSSAILIGPEGDFSGEELKQAVEAGFRMVTLGKNRLRTETAALTACQIINLANISKH